MSEWISVEKEPPKESGKYLCHVILPSAHGEFRRRVMDLYFSSYTKMWEVEGMIITHWQDLPVLPEVF